MKITTPAFEHYRIIPKKYTCQGENVSPPLIIYDIPSGTVSLALMIDDPDAPMTVWDYWIMWNIKPIEEIKENSALGT